MNKPGRPKKAKKDRKVALPLRVKRELKKRINEKTKGYNRNAAVERVLEANF
jgi:hypothetical protein